MNLSQWLETIQVLHPSEIDLGLHRVRTVAARLGLTRPAPLVITVAGTNGKGSTVAMLDAILRASGYRVGTYTSPHLLVYNERIGIQGSMVSDEALCDSFIRIDAVRGDISLTYFEFSTLAGLMLLEQAGLDVAVLEIGLGGRLDAVNIVDPDLAVVTSIGLDHQDWLGDTLEEIAREKAGIFRPTIPAICGDADVPLSLLAEAQRLGCPLYVREREFGYRQDDGCWSWWGKSMGGGEAVFTNLPLPDLDLVNAAGVLQGLLLLPLRITPDTVAQGLRGLRLHGRFQLLHDPEHPVAVRVDVAHNPHAAAMLAKKLSQYRERGEITGRVLLVLAMMADKDQPGFYGALESEVDIWYIAAFAQPRCLEAGVLYERLVRAGAPALGPFESVAQAYRQAARDARPGDLILATGSFVTVAELMQLLSAGNSNCTIAADKS